MYPRPEQPKARGIPKSYVWDLDEFLDKWNPIKGRHRALGTNWTVLRSTETTLRYFGVCLCGHQPTPNEWGSGLHSDWPTVAHRERYCSPIKGSITSLTLPPWEKYTSGTLQKTRKSMTDPQLCARGLGGYPRTKAEAKKLVYRTRSSSAGTPTYGIDKNPWRGNPPLQGLRGYTRWVHSHAPTRGDS